MAAYAERPPQRLSLADQHYIERLQAKTRELARQAPRPSPRETPLGGRVAVAAPAYAQAAQRETGSRLSPEDQQLLEAGRQRREQQATQIARTQAHLEAQRLPNRFVRAAKALKGLPPEERVITAEAEPVQTEEGHEAALPTPTEEELEAEIQARLAEREQELLPELEAQLRPEIEAELRQLLEEERLREEEQRRAEEEAGQTSDEAVARRQRVLRTSVVGMARQNPDAVAGVMREWIRESVDATGEEEKKAPIQKAATLFVELGPEIGGNIIKMLTDEQIEWIAEQIMKLGTLDESYLDSVFMETYERLREQTAPRGGEAYAKELLSKTFGAQKATTLLDRVRYQTEGAGKPFAFLLDRDPVELLNALQNEHPQTIALVISHLPPAQAATVLSGIAPDQQADIARRIATMEGARQVNIEAVETLVRKKLGPPQPPTTRTGGVQYLVNVLRNTDKPTEKTIMEILGEQNPELAEEIKRQLREREQEEREEERKAARTPRLRWEPPPEERDLPPFLRQRAPRRVEPPLEPPEPPAPDETFPLSAQIPPTPAPARSAAPPQQPRRGLWPFGRRGAQPPAPAAAEEPTVDLGPGDVPLFLRPRARVPEPPPTPAASPEAAPSADDLLASFNELSRDLGVPAENLGRAFLPTEANQAPDRRPSRPPTRPIEPS